MAIVRCSSRLVNEMYASGLSTRDVEDAFRDATGELLISKNAVSEITDLLCEDYQEFISRSLADIEVSTPSSTRCVSRCAATAPKRRLRMPTTVTSDGAPGLVKAIGVCFPTSIRIRLVPPAGQNSRQAAGGIRLGGDGARLRRPRRAHPDAARDGATG